MSHYSPSRLRLKAEMPPCSIPSPSFVEEHRCLSGLPGEEGLTASPALGTAAVGTDAVEGATGREAAAAAATAAATA